ncbi:MAG: hypothetical protein K0R38_1237 [Polyangiaceae bacterium]|nr:hypothetical protein [Polyangiaceae bacterium]
MFPCSNQGVTVARGCGNVRISARIVVPRPVLKFLLTLLVLAIAPSAWAQAGPSIDSVRGTISGSTRYVGFGGAFVAIADDTEGIPSNPAAVAVRLPYSWRAVDYGVGADVSVGAWLPKNDIYNQPPSDPAGKSSALVGSLAAIIYYRHLGFGIAAEARRNEASRTDAAQGVGIDLGANFGTVHAALAYGFMDGQVQLGAGPRFVGFSLSKNGPLAAGVGYEAGVIIKPTGLPYRVGASFKSAVDATLPSYGQGSSSNAYVPWEAAFGFAYQFGERPLNPWFVTTGDRVRRNVRGREPTRADYQTAERELYEEYQRRPRWYLLVSSELSLIEGGGRVGFSQQAARSRAIVSPRLGMETEVIPHYLKLRAGGYYEPARTEDSRARWHGTGGLDVKLFRFGLFGLLEPFDYWQLSLAADAARSYLNTSFSLGFWY